MNRPWCWSLPAIHGQGHLPTYLQVLKETHLAILEFSSTRQLERWQTFPEGWKSWLNQRVNQELVWLFVKIREILTTMDFCKSLDFYLTSTKTFNIIIYETGENARDFPRKMDRQQNPVANQQLIQLMADVGTCIALYWWVNRRNHNALLCSGVFSYTILPASVFVFG